ncbi:3-oxoacyl-[acyl-carrier-protein] reductase FabG-like [Bicyclus anynana]|uniref:3-oxoacyl-[acyl-carrier-protein] reductase FabG-like n=1 Tax=Bicyclus anynana TaxID=110368 RepID=A0A6J1MWK3_BICAN|nr:3-oxoacyl-[acyl-carrier-protein] reductase FabG-like [Bicyclus anynana]
MNFMDKVVIVTGASSGIGAAVAVKFAKEGATVAVVGRNQRKLTEVVKKCEENGGKAQAIMADVATEAGVVKIVHIVINNFRRIDVLVNNAGMGRFESILSQNAMKAFDQVMAVNLRGAVHLTHLAAPHLIESHGTIINISSIASMGVLSPKNFAYCASKAALDHFTRSVALELASNGVRINTINPGPVKTNFMDGLISDAKEREKSWETIKQRTALGRISEADEIADFVLYLASDRAKSITGSSFVIDNGLLLKG